MNARATPHTCHQTIASCKNHDGEKSCFSSPEYLFGSEAMAEITHPFARTGLPDSLRTPVPHSSSNEGKNAASPKSLHCHCTPVPRQEKNRHFSSNQRKTVALQFRVKKIPHFSSNFQEAFQRPTAGRRFVAMLVFDIGEQSGNV